MKRAPEDSAMMLGSQVHHILSQHLESVHTGHNRIDPPRDLQWAVERFRSRHGGLGVGHIPQERLQLAILALQRQGIAALTQGSRFILSYSLARPVSLLGGDCILSHDNLALPLIECWETEFRKGALSPMHWKGLIYSYLQAPPLANLNRLRVLLLSSMAAIVVKHRSKPRWLEVIDRHHHLLGRHPCDPYVEELLKGSQERRDELKRLVNIPEGSWLWQTMNRALIEEVQQMSDGRFRQVQRLILAFAKKEPLSRSAVRAAVLDRYSKL